MAFSKANSVTTVWGNKAVEMFVLTADANSGAVDTKLSVIEGIQIAVKSAATGSQKFKANLNSGATALNGSLFCSSCTNGDDFYVTVIGR
jgi:hypothetical protein